MKALILALALIVSPVMAQPPQPPADIESSPVQIMVHCVGSLTRMAEILASGWAEVPVVMSELKPDVNFILFSNHNFSTSTLVIHRASKESDSACIIWTGVAANPGGSFVVNANPVFPEPPPAPEGTEI
jgi:hypothetical protein